MRTAPAVIAMIVLALLVGVGGLVLSVSHAGARFAVVMPNAIGIVEGTPVQLDGFDVGHVDGVTIKGDKAVVHVRADDLPAPLHAGTTVTVEWRSVLGERYLQLRPGPAQNPVLPDGAMIEAGSSQVVVEDLLEALDAPTRSHLASLLRQLNTTMAGHQQDFNETLRAAGPSVQALGAVLNAVGTDGPAIKTVLANLQQVTSVLASRRDGLSSTVLDLNRLTGTVAVHEQQLSDGLGELPGTLGSAKAALDKLPAAADAVVPLLEDLRPVTDRLPGVAANLSPVMRELVPSLRLLSPTLDRADQLLGATPDFLDAAGVTVPTLRTTVQKAGPAVAFLRPYTPEVMGTLSVWGSWSALYDSQGHFGSVNMIAGRTSVDNHPDLLGPGESVKAKLLPGELVNQSWTDANGSGPR